LFKVTRLIREAGLARQCKARSRDEPESRDRETVTGRQIDGFRTLWPGTFRVESDISTSHEWPPVSWSKPCRSGRTERGRGMPETIRPDICVIGAGDGGLHRHLRAAGAGADDANVGSHRLRHARPRCARPSRAWFGPPNREAFMKISRQSVRNAPICRPTPNRHLATAEAVSPFPEPCIFAYHEIAPCIDGQAPPPV